jgi:hypothetical protein
MTPLGGPRSTPEAPHATTNEVDTISERGAKDVVEEMLRRQQQGDDTVVDDLVAADMTIHAAGPQGRVERWACRDDMGLLQQVGD